MMTCNFGQFSPTFTKKLEEWIDQLDAQVPPLKNFVIPVSFVQVLSCCVM
jgi:cob(I)alamin adenosyltransferase